MANEKEAVGTHRYGADLANRVERKWQVYWEEHQTFHVGNPGDPGFDPQKPKKFIMDMFPYPSGVGLHVGHPLGYIATDIYARYLRMTGHNVLHPMGFDAFGLPAEQFAIETGQHPRVTTEKNIATMREQMTRLGLGHDPQRFIATIDREFYGWTQWIFLQIYSSWFDPESKKARPIAELISELEAGTRPPVDAEANPEARSWGELDAATQTRIVDNQRLAYLAEVPVNWCPSLGTVLANEEVTAEGRSERGNFPVFKRPLKQWMMRITAYCDRLLEDLEPLDWPEPIKIMQRNWIGRSEGAEVDFYAGRLENEDAWFGARQMDGWPLRVADGEPTIRVFTTRPDTLYGATYMVLAPEHPLVDELVAQAWPDGSDPRWRGQFPGVPGGDASPRDYVAAYRAYAASRSDIERQVEAKEKTGVFIGAFAINPVNRQPIPVFIADYVLMGYGTGAIMAVPAHDERDFEFATQFGLDIPVVVMPPESWLREQIGSQLRAAGIESPSSEDLEGAYQHAGESSHPLGCHCRRLAAFAGSGRSVASAAIEGRETADAKRRITRWLSERGVGEGTVNYRLRDWLFSRQRYWGEPFPVLHGADGEVVPLGTDELPLELPAMDDFSPEINDDLDSEPSPPLGRAREWAGVERDGKVMTRELNTMPNWAGSCWYYLRYLDPHNSAALVDPKVEKYWMGTASGDGEKAIGGVDLYVGGAEHAVLHLLYSRFWHKILFDLGHVSTPEPFQRLFNQGYVQAAAYKDDREVYFEASRVVEKDGEFFFDGHRVKREFGKMGKSLKNAVTPDEICSEYGADTLRLYEMYMGPLEASKPWNTRDIIGAHRFLQRLWRNLVDEDSGTLRVSDAPPSDALRKLLHQTIAGVEHDMRSLGFNTAIAKLIELNNALVALDSVPREVAASLVKMLAPLAPHIAEELWERLGHVSSVAYEPFPEHDPNLLREDEIEIPVMVNGKVRAKVNIAAGVDRQAQETAARANEKIQSFIADKTVKKVIVVPGKMVNFVV